MLERILGIILPVFVVIVVGYLYGRRVKPDMTEVNRLSMTILSPALIFSALASKEFAEQFKQEPAKVASIVLIGNVLSVVFVPIGLALAIR